MREETEDQALAHGLLDAFIRIAGVAANRLAERSGMPADAFAVMNVATAEAKLKHFADGRAQLTDDWQRLVHEPFPSQLTSME